jgi:hypothetical protein
LKKVRHAATIADCDCWVLPTARLDARIVIAALGSPSTGDDYKRGWNDAMEHAARTADSLVASSPHNPDNPGDLSAALGDESSDAGGSSAPQRPMADAAAEQPYKEPS